jgi:hypothetical protein
VHHAWHGRWAAFRKVYGACWGGLVVAAALLLVVGSLPGPAGWGALAGLMLFIPAMSVAAVVAGLTALALGRLGPAGSRRLQTEH